MSEGFVLKGKDTREFLQDILKKNEFIVYWYPLMKDNSYNLIHFAGEKYTNSAPLTITPQPDSVLRVFMVFKPFDKFIKIPK